VIRCYTPAEFEAAYGVAPLLSHGSTEAARPWSCPRRPRAPSSSGLVPTDIRWDLAAFDSKFGLRAAKLNVVNTIARSATPYLAASEEVEDTEMVHAIAPGATRDVVLVPRLPTPASRPSPPR
jgi:hypothetical protein